MNDDNELLRRFVQDGSDSAFSELVSRHFQLVYSAAVRQSSGDIQTAQDIVQIVFIDLARHAKSLLRHESIAGWLYTSVRFSASKARRSELRRKNRERLAVMNQSDTSGSSSTWEEIAPILDDAIAELNSEDRLAILHRFLKDSDFRAVGAILGVSEDAARMRVHRAVEKLQSLLTQRGVTLAASALATLLASQSVLAAPAGFESQVKNLSFRGAAVGGVSLYQWLQQLLGSNWKWALPAGALLFIATIAYFKNPIDERLSQKPNVAASIVSSQPEPTAPSLADPGASQSESTSSHTLFRAVDALSSAPLPGVKLRFTRFPRDGSMVTDRFETDAEGSAQLPRLPFNSTANLFATAPGHIPLVVSWRRGMPEDYTMKMPRGLHIGGIIIDQANQPIQGATIEFKSRGSETHLRENIQFGPDTRQTSDDRGRWFSDMIPTDYSTIPILLNHPGFAVTVTNVPVNAASTNLVLIMKSGVEISGAVTDSAGHPVIGATVKEIHNRSEPKLSATTDDSGRFRLQHVRPGEILLSFLPATQPLAPAVRELIVSNQPIDLQVILEPGHILRGQVIDENNLPITNAIVRTASDSQGERKVEWSTNVDSAGRFKWLGAPAEPLLYSFSAKGFYGASSRSLKADGSLHQIQMKPVAPVENSDPITITGVVTDDQTTQPLPAFDVLIATQENPNASRRLEFAAEGRDGKFKLHVDRSAKFQLQFQAHGYETLLSSHILANDRDQSLHFQMRKGKGLFGLVLTTDATPLFGADVFLYDDERSGVYLDKPPRARDSSVTSARRSITDEEGRFSFNPTGNGIGLIALHEFGYAEIPLAEFQSHLVLQPWGRVEGKLINADRPMPNERINISNFHPRYRADGRDFPPLRLSLETTTDSQGRYVFEKVPPGERIISHWLTKPGKQIGRIYHGRELPFHLKPGETTHIDLGGQGATLTARATFPSDQTINWHTTPVELRLKVPTPLGDYPRPNAFPTSEAFLEASKRYAAGDRAFWSSPAGLEATRARRTYWAFCAPDGAFTFHDIPPGSYEFQIEFSPPHSPLAPTDPLRGSPAIASLTAPVTIPSPESHINLGLLELKPMAASK